jgi:small multidrug resistance pump
MTKWAMLGGAVISEVTATLSLKGALDHPLLYAVVAVGYAISFVLLALLLRRGVGLGVVYGIWGATGVAVTAVLSAVIFDEALTATGVLGIALVIAGVLTVEFGSQRAHAASHRAGLDVDDDAVEEQVR